MFQQMVNGSIAVLTKPSVSTFEEHEQNNLAWALIYSVLAGVINAILAAIGVSLGLNAVDTSALDPSTAAALEQAGSGGLIGSIIGTLIFTPIALLIGWGIVYGLGRAFGGTGQFGELAFDLALFNAPTSVLGSLLNLIPIIGPLAAFALGIYNLYLTYLAIQSGMNLPSQKALYVILILAAIFLLIFCGVFGVAFLALLGAGALSQ
jgi:hypothetical protein